MEEGTSKSPGHTGVTHPAQACGDGTHGHASGEGCDYDARQWDVREGCEVRQILDRVADKWSLLVIALLDRRTLRFTELRREVDGISQRMLTVTCASSNATASSAVRCTPSCRPGWTTN